MLSFVALGLLLVNWASATHGASTKSCQDYVFPVTVTSINFIWGLPPLTTNFDAAAFNTALGTWNANVSFHPISGGAPATASYKIAGTLCKPTKKGSGTLLVATHGFGFDRRYEFEQTSELQNDKTYSYWDPDIQPEKYSFVDYAIAKGHSVFFYDR